MAGIELRTVKLDITQVAPAIFVKCRPVLKLVVRLSVEKSVVFLKS